MNKPNTRFHLVDVPKYCYVSHTIQAAPLGGSMETSCIGALPVKIGQARSFFSPAPIQLLWDSREFGVEGSHFFASDGVVDQSSAFLNGQTVTR